MIQFIRTHFSVQPSLRWSCLGAFIPHLVRVLWTAIQLSNVPKMLQFQFHFGFPFTRLHPPSPCHLLSGDPKQSAEIPFYCPGNGVIWGFRLFRCIPSKMLSKCWNSEIVVRWKAGPLLLLFQTKAEIVMGFDFPDTPLGLDWFEQPKSKHSSRLERHARISAGPTQIKDVVKHC